MCVEDLITTAMSVLAKNFVKFSEVDGFSPDVSCEFLEMCLVRNNLALGAMKEDEDEDGVLRDKFRDRELREEKVGGISLIGYFRNLSNWAAARPVIRPISGHLAVAPLCNCARIEGVRNT